MYFFGSFYAGVSLAWIRAVEAAIAGAQLDVQLTANYTDEPGRTPRGWFATPNMGAPFDSSTASATLRFLERKNLWSNDAPVLD